MTTWLVRKTGNDQNGGTSKTVRSTVNDAVTNGTNTVTSVSNPWAAGDVGHGIYLSGLNVWRIITGFNSAGSIVVSGAVLGAGVGRTATVGGAFRSIRQPIDSGFAVVPIAAGDSIYIGAGVYREGTIAVSYSGSVGNPITIAGDVDGAVTGDAGEVQVTGWPISDHRVGNAGNLLTLAARSYVTIKNVYFHGGTSGNAITHTGAGVGCIFQDCLLMSSFQKCFSMTAVVDTNHNLLFDRCRIIGLDINDYTVQFTIPTSTVADYDVGVVFQNCLIWSVSGQPCHRIDGSGANTFKGGGIDLNNCTVIGGSLTIGNSTISTTIPCTVTNCLLIRAPFSANTTGQYIEDNNVYVGGGTPRSNVTAGTRSVMSQYAPLISWGHEHMWGGQPRPMFSPSPGSPLLGWSGIVGGGNAVPTVDLLGRPRPSGGQVLFSGTATAGAALTLTDSGQAWGTNVLVDRVVKIISGTGSGQVKRINANTATVLTVDGNWQTNPDATSAYRIYTMPLATGGMATSGSGTHILDSNAVWATDTWKGYFVEITAGTGSGQTRTVSTNSDTDITVTAAWTTNPDATSVYRIYRITSVDTPAIAVGAFERHDNVVREATVVDASTYAMALAGQSDVTISIPVDATSSTISIRTRFDAEHATTNRPRAVLLANAEIGVTTQTVTAVGAVDTWETLTFTAQTPSAKGIVQIRLEARSATGAGRAFFDTLSVT
jgi:hypothetical protein